MKEQAVISVVVPVYNMEKYLSRCVDSILGQTYQNLEIILVDDSSQDNSPNIIQQYVESDQRIKTVRHEQNRGLFQARITGAKLATGKYLAFVDADDYISIDWFRKLLNKAEDTKSDITVGEFCFDNDGKFKNFMNLDPFRLNDYLLEGDEILKQFIQQEGTCFSWWVVWNKLYSMELWKQCESHFIEFSEEHGHMLMWEDVTFSSCLWSKAKRVSNAHGVYYFYFKHTDASTIIKNNEKQNQKYINDSSSAMVFMGKMLNQSGRYAQLETHYINWRNNAGSLLYRDLCINLGCHQYEKEIREKFCIKDQFVELNEFFYQTMTPLQNSFSWWENIIKKIISEKTKVVSFDVFDTLVQRPFLKPTDLFYLLSDKFNETTSSYVDFVGLRIEAEWNCRQKKWLIAPQIEDITLDEIYEELSSLTCLPQEELEQLKKLEIELELFFLETRKSGKELFDIAKHAGKKVIICSDMYLPHDVIHQILNKNGYDGFEKLYVSSQTKLTKGRGTIYPFIANDLGITDSSQLLHIGDNWESDETSALNQGWQASYLPRASLIYKNEDRGIWAGETWSKVFRNSVGTQDLGMEVDYFPAMRNIIALSANKFFDNPFVSINHASDFNADPNIIGYSLLGPHLLALSEWIGKLAIERKIPTIHFVARDGFMVKQAFDRLNRTQTKTNYIRLSRKALVLSDVNSEKDLYSIRTKINIYGQTPSDFIAYLKPLIPANKTDDKIAKCLAYHEISIDKKFQNETEYLHFIKVMIKEVIDISLLSAHKEKLRKYFADIVSPGDYIFDIGYSGRSESALSNLLGFPIGSMYVHINSDVAKKRQQRYNCPCECFYGYKPKITGVMREHLIMELGPSTIGYIENNGKLEPLLETYQDEYCSTFMTNIVQQASLQFIEDYLKTFGQFRDNMVLQNIPLSAPFEYYLHNSKAFDRQLFSTLPFEDSLGAEKILHALDFWNNDIAVYKLDIHTQNNSELPDVIKDINLDGLFVKFYKRMNKWFPKGRRSRKIVKKIGSIFFH